MTEQGPYNILGQTIYIKHNPSEAEYFKKACEWVNENLSSLVKGFDLNEEDKRKFDAKQRDFLENHLKLTPGAISHLLALGLDQVSAKQQILYLKQSLDSLVEKIELKKA